MILRVWPAVIALQKPKDYSCYELNKCQKHYMYGVVILFFYSKKFYERLILYGTIKNMTEHFRIVFS